MSNSILHHAAFTPRKLIAWTLIATLICQPMIAIAGIKSGAISTKIIAQYATEAATAFIALPALDQMGNSLFWQQAGLNATARGSSPIESSIAVRTPAGTKVYVGEVGSQGGFYVGGTPQIVVPKPWTIDGVKVLDVKPLK